MVGAWLAVCSHGLSSVHELVHGQGSRDGRKECVCGGEDWGHQSYQIRMCPTTSFNLNFTS